MTTAITIDQLPTDVQSALLDGESPLHFEFIDMNGGCLTTQTAKQWLLVTDSRVVFEASVKESSPKQSQFKMQAGSIPLAKVSYTGVSEEATGDGCSGVAAASLKIGGSGGDIVLAMPTRAQADRARRVIDERLSR